MTGRRKLVRNSLSLLVNRLAQSLAAFILVAYIARALGSYGLGQYTLAFTYYFVFMTFASSGFKSLFTRELARNPLEIPVYLSNGTLLQLLFSIVSYLMLVIVVFVLPYSSDTSMICYIMGLAIIPFSLSNITEAIFQAQERMNLIAVSTVPIYILRLLIMVWGMQAGYGVTFVAAIFAISETIILVVEWGLITRRIKPQWQISWDFMRRIMKTAIVFIGIDSLSLLKDRIQIFILSLLIGEISVGLYGAVLQLMQPFQLISYSLVIAVFPSMSKVTHLDREERGKIAISVIEMLLCIALPLVVGLSFVGRDLLVLIYRDPGFSEAFAALMIVSLGLVASCFIQPLGYSLVANGFERINLIEVAISAIASGLLGTILISFYRLNGAAITLLSIQIAACGVYVYWTTVHLFPLNLWQLLRRPLCISLFMLVIFLVLQQLSHALWLTLFAATLAYVVLVSALVVQILGGPGIVWAKLFRKV